MSQIRKITIAAIAAIAITASFVATTSTADAYFRGGDGARAHGHSFGHHRRGGFGHGMMGGMALGLGAVMIGNAIAQQSAPEGGPWVTRERPRPTPPPQRVRPGKPKPTSVGYGSTVETGLKRVDDLPRKADLKNDCLLLKGKINRLKGTLIGQQRTLAALNGVQNVNISDTNTGVSTSFGSEADRLDTINNLKSDMGDTEELIKRYEDDLARCLANFN